MSLFQMIHFPKIHGEFSLFHFMPEHKEMEQESEEFLYLFIGPCFLISR